MLYINIKTTMFARSRVCQNCTKIILEHFSQRSLNSVIVSFISSIISFVLLLLYPHVILSLLTSARHLYHLPYACI